MALIDDEKWEAVVSCDKIYDEQFLYGVKTTSIFCRPSCRSRVPVRKNVTYFDNLGEAYASGFRPCKRCRPDLTDEKLAKRIVQKAKKTYDTDFNNDKKMSAEIKELGVTQGRLIELFQKQIGSTPKEYVEKLRIEKAVELLDNPKNTLMMIASNCGFGSISSFTNLFKKKMGYTFEVYRKTKIQHK
ncbi:Ada metal-binding domain-containing protein [Clostridium sp. OS1-26]|uniref:Ada metal-binding domain-containing protein n=1 Tax=Clostridium sp. OS1-26 TaxID=3070681 RepID=UPI0027E1C33D|nr:Ada metal-binding domain-containing protein [Clostridium sp. OS1-26]WML34533.1 Ada metal-binding domain-containing protein [Clostridium sp. OS1-26]